jgi:hypothetical protein
MGLGYQTVATMSLAVLPDLAGVSTPIGYLMTLNRAPAPPSIARARRQHSMPPCSPRMA